jgi:hypothetical protein
MQPDFLLGYLPFWIIVYGLAIIAWTCLGRFLLSFFLPPDSPNYIWRIFCRISDWAVSAATFITPRIVHPVLLAPIAALWLFLIRAVVFVAMFAAGLTPSVTAPGAGQP